MFFSLFKWFLKRLGDLSLDWATWKNHWVCYLGGVLQYYLRVVVVGWLIVVDCIHNQSNVVVGCSLLVVLFINCDRHLLLVVLITGIVILVIGCQDPIGLGVL